MEARLSVHYERAPITEAVIDIHAAFDPVPNAQAIEAFGRGLKDRFPHQHAVKALMIAMHAHGDSLSSNTTSSGAGVRVATERNDRVLQLRPGEFVYSHMPPYTEWAKFRDEAVELWAKVSAAFNPTRVNRTAIRYINRIVVPMHVDLDKYLNLTPRLLPQVGEEIEGYFMQLLLPQRDIDPECKCVINTGIEESSVPDCMSVLFDVDVFVPHPDGIAIEAVWPLLERLRDRKNDIFEAAITDAVRRIIT